VQDFLYGWSRRIARRSTKRISWRSVGAGRIPSPPCTRTEGPSMSSSATATSSVARHGSNGSLFAAGSHRMMVTRSGSSARRNEPGTGDTSRCRHHRSGSGQSTRHWSEPGGAADLAATFRRASRITSVSRERLLRTNLFLLELGYAGSPVCGVGAGGPRPSHQRARSHQPALCSWRNCCRSSRSA
jgi:hypothetical protein